MSPRVELLSGDILATTCPALVSPVDIIGAQDKGLAARIRERWPAPCRRYKDLCRRRGMHAGEVAIDSDNAPWIIFAATNGHWSGLVRLSWVERILEHLVEAPELVGLDGIAIPALGCGLGGLDWNVVRPLILDAAERMPVARVEVYAPR